MERNRYSSIFGGGTGRCSKTVFFTTFYLLTCDLWLGTFLVVSFTGGGANAKKKELHIGGIFPINGTGGWQGGQACEPAAQMALSDVNKNTDLLSGYTLKLHWHDSEVINTDLLPSSQSIIYLNSGNKYGFHCLNLVRTWSRGGRNVSIAV